MTCLAAKPAWIGSKWCIFLIHPPWYEHSHICQNMNESVCSELAGSHWEFCCMLNRCEIGPEKLKYSEFHSSSGLQVFEQGIMDLCWGWGRRKHPYREGDLKEQGWEWEHREVETWLLGLSPPLLDGENGKHRALRYCEVAQSCPTLCDPIVRNPPGSSIHGILQARVLEWVAISFSRGSSQPRDQTQLSCIAGRRFTIWATREAVKSGKVGGFHFLVTWLHGVWLLKIESNLEMEKSKRRERMASTFYGQEGHGLAASPNPLPFQRPEAPQGG